MTKKQFWNGAWNVGFFGYMAGIVFWIISGIPTNENPHPHPLPVYALLLWIGVPIFWMLCSGFGLHDVFEYELGWRTETHGPNNEYSRKVDTTPVKRIILQWLAPLALAYFLIRRKWRKQVAHSAR